MANKERSLLIKVRRDAGLKQRELAPMIDKSQTWLSFIERGIEPIKRRDQIKLAKALNVDLETLGFEAE